MSRFTISFALFSVLAACSSPSEFAAQCDDETALDDQVVCLDQSFQQLRAAAAVCDGVDVRERTHTCADRCAYSDIDAETCRRACGQDDETRPEDRPEREEERPERAEERPERELDETHFRVRDEVRRSDDTRVRRDRIRDGLTRGEDLTRCERGDQR